MELATLIISVGIAALLVVFLIHFKVNRPKGRFYYMPVWSISVT